MAIYADFSIDQGANFIATLGVADSLSNENDLTGYTAVGQMRRSYSAADAVDITCDITNPENGEIEISLSNTVTSTLRRGRWLYDIFITSPSGFKTRVVEGIIDVAPSVTREL